MDSNEIKKAPKLFCESIHIAYSPEYFVCMMRSGNQAQFYSLTPAHAKRLHQYLGHQLKEYEEKNGEISTKWDPSIVSPVQRANKPLDGS